MTYVDDPRYSGRRDEELRPIPGRDGEEPEEYRYAKRRLPTVTEEPEPTGLLGMAGRGLKAATNWTHSFITGEGRRIDGIQELPTSARKKLLASDETSMSSRTGFNLDPRTIGNRMSFAKTSQGKLDILEKQLGDRVQAMQDKYGNVIVTFNENQASVMGEDIVPGRPYYLNRPGMSRQDAADLVNLVGFEAAGIYGGLKGVNVAKNLVGRVGRRTIGSGIGAAAGSVAQDVAAEEQGSEQGIDTLGAIGAGLTAGAFEFGGIYLSQWLRQLRGWVQHSERTGVKLVKSGGGDSKELITKEGFELIEKQTGVKPDDVTPEMAEEFVKLTKKDKAPTALLAPAADARSLPYKVPMSKGDLTRNPQIQRQEELMRQGHFGEEAQTVAQQFRDTQQAALRRNVEAIQRGVKEGGGFRSGKGGGYQDEIHLGSDAASPVPTFEVARSGLQRQADKMNRNISDAYDAAEKAGAMISTPHARQMVGRLGTKIDEHMGIENAPPEVRNLIAQLDRQLQDADQAIPINWLENWLKRVNTLIRVNSGPNSGTTRFALGVLKSEYENFMEAAARRGYVIGSPGAVNKFRQARALRRQYAEMFDNDKLLPKIMERETINGQVVYKLSDEEAEKLIFAGDGLRMKQGAPQTLNRIKLLLGENSSEWRDLKLNVIIRLLGSQRHGARNNASMAIDFSGRRFMHALQDLQRNGSAYGTLFNAEERALLDQLARVSMRATDRVTGAVNYSGSGNAVITMAQWFAGRGGPLGNAVSSILKKLDDVLARQARALDAQKNFSQDLNKMSKEVKEMAGRYNQGFNINQETAPNSFFVDENGIVHPIFGQSDPIVPFKQGNTRPGVAGAVGGTWTADERG